MPGRRCTHLREGKKGAHKPHTGLTGAKPSASGGVKKKGCLFAVVWYSFSFCPSKNGDFLLGAALSTAHFVAVLGEFENPAPIIGTKASNPAPTHSFSNSFHFPSKS